MRAINATHELLQSYAAHRYTLTVAGTVGQLTEWWLDHSGRRIPERTFQRHTKVLRDLGLIHVRHTRSRTWYTLMGLEIKVPKVGFLPTSRPGQFDIVETGTEAVSIAHVNGAAEVEAEHRAAIASLDTVLLDVLHESWGVSLKGRPA